MATIRILIADDHQPVRQNLRQMCEPEEEFEVVGEAENGRDVVAFAHSLQPDVILIDVGMSIIDGVEATSLITAQNPSTRVIALTANLEGAEALKALKAGAYGYLLKCTDANILVEAIQTHPTCI